MRAAFININTSDATTVVAVIAITFLVSNTVSACCIDVTLINCCGAFIDIDTNKAGVVKAIIGFKPGVAFTNKTPYTVATFCIDIARIRVAFINVGTADSVPNITNIAEANKTAIVVGAGRFTVTIVSTTWITLVDIEAVFAIAAVPSVTVATKATIGVGAGCVDVAVVVIGGVAFIDV